MRYFGLVILSGLLLAAAGCSQEEHQTTAQEKKQFLGGPMPKDFAKKLQGDIERSSAGAKRPNGGGTPPADAPAGGKAAGSPG